MLDWVLGSLVVVVFWLSNLTTLMTFVVALVPAAAIGLTFYWFSPKLSRVVSLGITWTLGVLALVGSSIVFLIHGVTTAAPDAAEFHSTNARQVSIQGPHGVEVVTLLSPREIPDDEDRQLELRVPFPAPGSSAASAATSTGPNASDFASVRTGKEACVRALLNTAPCRAAAASAAENAEFDTPACAELSMPNEEVFRWVVRGAKPGRSYTVMTLPSRFRDVLTANWTATGNTNGRAWTRMVAGADQHPWTGGMDRDGLKEIPLVLSSARPYSREIASDEDFAVNLQELTLQVKLTFSTTLGMSPSTYAALALVGAILSSGLGSGWLIALVKALRDRNKPKPHVPVRRR